MAKRNLIIYIFIGTTAELIKLIPVIKELQKRNVVYRIVLSGQTEINFGEFEKLIGKQNIYHNFRSKFRSPSPFYFFLWIITTTFEVVSWVKREFSENSGSNSNKVLLVQGDTATAAIGAFAAYVGRIKLAHVEAGLRSHNILEPFPEEICRNFISYFSDINFCPNKSAFKNIEGRKGNKINTNWNTSVEALNMALRLKPKLTLIGNLKSKPYFIFILHRQEHMYLRKNDTEKLIEIVTKNATKKLQCLFIAHDVTKNYLSDLGLWKKIINNKNIKVVKHLPYLEFVHVLKNSKFIATDGGGNHTESHYLGLPCLILRRKIEQNEGIGENVILSKENKEIIENFFKNYNNFKRKPQKLVVLPSKIIVDTLTSNL